MLPEILYSENRSFPEARRQDVESPNREKILDGNLVPFTTCCTYYSQHITILYDSNGGRKVPTFAFHSPGITCIIIRRGHTRAGLPRRRMPIAFRKQIDRCPHLHEGCCDSASGNAKTIIPVEALISLVHEAPSLLMPQRRFRHRVWQAEANTTKLAPDSGIRLVANH